MLRDAHGGIALPSSPPMTERDGVVAESLLSILVYRRDPRGVLDQFSARHHEAVEGGTATVMACSGCLAAMHGVSDRASERD